MTLTRRAVTARPTRVAANLLLVTARPRLFSLLSLLEASSRVVGSQRP